MASRASSLSDAFHARALFVDEPGRKWFSILTRKRLRAPNFDDVRHFEAAVTQFIAEWNEIAKPFAWTPKSFAKVLDRQATPLREAA